MKLCSFGVYHVAPFTTTIGSITCSTIFHPAEVQTLCCRPDSKSRCARKWAEMVCHFQGETSSASIKGLLWTSFKEILFLINPVQKKKGKVWESPPAHCNFRGCFPPPVERFDSLVVTESLFGKRCPRHASWNAIRSKLRAFKPGMSYHKITKISRTTSNFRRTVIFQVLPQWRCTSQKPRCLTKCCRCDIHALHAWWPPTPGRFLWRKDGCRRIGTPQITGSNTKLRFLTG
jgi:hypothetical protein